MEKEEDPAPVEQLPDLNLSAVVSTGHNEEADNFENLVNYRGTMRDDIGSEDDSWYKRFRTIHPSDPDLTGNLAITTQFHDNKQDKMTIGTNSSPDAKNLHRHQGGCHSVMEYTMDSQNGSSGLFGGSTASMFLKNISGTALSHDNGNTICGDDAVGDTIPLRNFLPQVDNSYPKLEDNMPLGPQSYSQSRTIQQPIQNIDDTFQSLGSSIRMFDTDLVCDRRQLNSSHTLKIDRSYPGMMDNKPVGFIFNGQGESSSASMVPNAFQPTILHNPQSGGSFIDLQGGIVSDFHSKIGRHYGIMDSVDQSNDLSRSPTDGKLLTFGSKFNVASRFQSGNQYINAVGIPQSEILSPGIGRDTAFLSDNNDCNDVHDFGDRSTQLDIFSRVQTGGNLLYPGGNISDRMPSIGPSQSMHSTNIKPITSSNILQNLPMHGQYHFPVNLEPSCGSLGFGSNREAMHANSGLYCHPTAIASPDNELQAAVHGLAENSGMAVTSFGTTNYSNQVFSPLVHEGYPQNMRASATNPYTAQIVNQHSVLHGLPDHNMNIQRAINFRNTDNYHYLAGLSSANYSQDHFGLASTNSVVQDPQNPHAQVNKAILIQPPAKGAPHDTSTDLGLLPGGISSSGIGHTIHDVKSLPILAKSKKGTSIDPSFKGFPHVPAKGLSDSNLIVQNARSLRTRASKDTLIKPFPKVVPVSLVPAQGIAKIPLKCSNTKRATASSNVPPKRTTTAPAGPKDMRIKSVASPLQQPGVVCHIQWQESNDIVTPLGERCNLCNIDLAFSPTGSSSHSQDPPMSAVLPCGHCFHDSCLEQIGVLTENCKDPPCVACGSNGDQNKR